MDEQESEIKKLIRRVEKMTKDVRELNQRIEREQKRVQMYHREITTPPEVFEQS